MGHYFETLEELGRWGSSRRVVVDPGVDVWSFGELDAEGGRYFAQQPELRRVVGFIARQVASVNLNLYSWDDEGGRARLYPGQHPAARFLESPAGDEPGQTVTAMGLKEQLLIDKLIFDRFCAQIEYDDMTGLPIKMTRLPAGRVKFHGKAGIVHGATYHREDGQKIELDLESLHYQVGYTAGTGANGTSPIKAIRQLLDGSQEALQFRSQMLARAARIPGILKHPGVMDDKQFERLQSSWGEFAANGAKAGSEPILEGGTTYEQLKPLSGDDVLDLDGRKLSAEEIATMYWIYPELLGLREGTNSNMDAMKQALWSICLAPYVTEWQQAWDRMVRTQFRTKNRYVDADLDGKMMGSWKEESEVTSRAVGGPTMTRNEARARRNLPPLPGGDELIVPLNVTEGGKASPMDGE